MGRRKGGDLEAGARGPGDGLLLLLVHAGCRLRGDQPLPSLPGHPAPPPCSRKRAWKRNENPNDFKKTTQRKTPGISRETAGKNKGARIPVELRFGAHDSRNAAADSSEMSRGIARGGGFLPVLGFSLSLRSPFLLSGQGFIIRGEEAFWGFGFVDGLMGLLWAK
jgi:hypothetical protein